MHDYNGDILVLLGYRATKFNIHMTRVSTETEGSSAQYHQVTNFECNLQDLRFQWNQLHRYSHSESSSLSVDTPHLKFEVQLKLLCAVTIIKAEYFHKIVEADT